MRGCHITIMKCSGVFERKVPTGERGGRDKGSVPCPLVPEKEGSCRGRRQRKNNRQSKVIPHLPSQGKKVKKGHNEDNKPRPTYAVGTELGGEGGAGKGGICETDDHDRSLSQKRKRPGG